jgi:hypothetical protein
MGAATAPGNSAILYGPPAIAYWFPLRDLRTTCLAGNIRLPMAFGVPSDRSDVGFQTLAAMRRACSDANDPFRTWAAFARRGATFSRR